MIGDGVFLFLCLKKIMDATGLVAGAIDTGWWRERSGIGILWDNAGIAIASVNLRQRQFGGGRVGQKNALAIGVDGWKASAAGDAEEQYQGNTADQGTYAQRAVLALSAERAGSSDLSLSGRHHAVSRSVGSWSGAVTTALLGWKQLDYLTLVTYHAPADTLGQGLRTTAIRCK